MHPENAPSVPENRVVVSTEIPFEKRPPLPPGHQYYYTCENRPEETTYLSESDKKLVEDVILNVNVSFVLSTLT